MGIAYFEAEVLTQTDYYPFGMMMPDRQWSAGAEGYRYGFNTQEKDDEIYGTGNSYSAEFWQYDARLGRRWNLDPKFYKFPWSSPFVVLGDNPIMLIDPEGDEWTSSIDKNTGEVKYTPQEGDNYKTFISQYDVSEKEANEIFTKAGLTEYLPQKVTVDKTIFGIKYGEEEITSYKSFKKGDKLGKGLKSDNLFKISNTVSDQTSINHLQSVLEYSRSKGQHSVDLKKYFNYRAAGYTFKEGHFIINGKKYKVRAVSMQFAETTSIIPSSTKTTLNGQIFILTFQIIQTKSVQMEGIMISFDHSDVEDQDKIWKHFAD